MYATHRMSEVHSYDATPHKNTISTHLTQHSLLPESRTQNVQCHFCYAGLLRRDMSIVWYVPSSVPPLHIITMHSTRYNIRVFHRCGAMYATANTFHLNEFFVSLYMFKMYCIEKIKFPKCTSSATCALHSYP